MAKNNFFGRCYPTRPELPHSRERSHSDAPKNSGRIIDNLQIDNRQIDNRQTDTGNLTNFRQIDNRKIDNRKTDNLSYSKIDSAIPLPCTHGLGNWHHGVIIFIMGSVAESVCF